MGRKNNGGVERVYNGGAWTAEEVTQSSHYIHIHGPKKWRIVATKSGLNRCGKSCRLRWLNYLRPNIKRGNISGDSKRTCFLGFISFLETGRIDNEIKNYWNSHLSKKINQKEEKTATSKMQDALTKRDDKTAKNKKGGVRESGDADFSVDANEFFFSQVRDLWVGVGEQIS